MADDNDLSKAETIIDGNGFNCDKCGKCCIHIDECGAKSHHPLAKNTNP